MGRAVGSEQRQERSRELVVLAAPVVGEADFARQIPECRQPAL